MSLFDKVFGKKTKPTLPAKPQNIPQRPGKIIAIGSKEGYLDAYSALLNQAHNKATVFASEKHGNALDDYILSFYESPLKLERAAFSNNTKKIVLSFSYPVPEELEDNEELMEMFDLPCVNVGVIEIAYNVNQIILQDSTLFVNGNPMQKVYLSFDGDFDPEYIRKYELRDDENVISSKKFYINEANIYNTPTIPSFLSNAIEPSKNTSSANVKPIEPHEETTTELNTAKPDEAEPIADMNDESIDRNDKSEIVMKNEETDDKKKDENDGASEEGGNEGSNVIFYEYQRPDLDLYEGEFKAALESKAFLSMDSPCGFLLGTDKKGTIHTADLALLNNLLIIGSLGTGKTTFLDSYLLSVINKASPDNVRLIVMSAKPNELTQYSSLPHLYCPIVVDPIRGRGIIRWLQDEADQRSSKFAKIGARSIERYNSLQESAEDRIPRLVVVIDGIDILKYGADDTEESMFELLGSGRNVGIHFVVTATHLGYNTFSLRCQSCIPNRISFRTVTGRQSLTGIGIHGAEKLAGLGKMLYSSVYTERPIELQAFYINEDTVDKVMSFFVSQQKPTDSLLEKLLDSIPDLSAPISYSNGNHEDDLLPDAVRIVLDSGSASIAMLQRRMRVGYARAARLVDVMEQHGFVSGFDGSTPRKVLIDEEGYCKFFGGNDANS